MLSAGADPNCLNLYYYSPLHLAVNRNHDNIVELLLAYNADPNIIGHTGMTPLHFAAYHGNNVISHRLISEGANVNTVNKKGKTPLHYAAKQGNIDIVSELIFAGAIPDPVDQYGRTPLDLARKREKMDVVEYLESLFDDDPNIIDDPKTKITHLMRAVLDDQRDKIYVYGHLGLLDDIDVQDHKGNTALIYAVMNNNLNVAQILLYYNADPMIANYSGHTAINFAKNDEMIDLLINNS